MPYVLCSNCQVGIHITVTLNNLDEFNKRFIDGDEPVYCLKCFKEKEKNKEEIKNKTPL